MKTQSYINALIGGDTMKITTSFSIEKTIYNIAKKQADKENRKFSNLVETALIEYLKSRKANKNAEHPTNG